MAAKTVVAAAIGECVHVAGISNFLRLAEQVGWRVVFLGPATDIHKVLAIAAEEKADLVGVSYRLTPDNGERLLAEFAEEADELYRRGVKFAFGGTPPVVERIKGLNLAGRAIVSPPFSDFYLAGDLTASRGNDRNSERPRFCCL